MLEISIVVNLSSTKLNVISFPLKLSTMNLIPTLLFNPVTNSYIAITNRVKLLEIISFELIKFEEVKMRL